MGFDAWKSDDTAACEHELRTERDQYEAEQRAERALPLYRLRTWYDAYFGCTTAQLLVRHDDTGWRVLDEGTARGDDPTAAVRCMTEQRRRLRGVL